MGQDRRILVTGAARYSLGEAIVLEYLKQSPNAKLFTINRTANPDLDPRISQIVFDLNPLNHPGGIDEFDNEISELLDQSVQATGARGIDCLVQTAGAYDYGLLTEDDAIRRSRILGLNILGSVEVLSSVLHLNTRYPPSNQVGLTHVFIGAFQGLEVREKRQLYASSKAWAIDFCSSLEAGREVERCIYAAPGPIDTPMLHRNHWVNKAKGSERLFEEILRGPREQYEAVFLRGEASTLIECAQQRGANEVDRIKEAMVLYGMRRSETKVARLGLLSAASCAQVIVDTESCDQRGSGVYLIGNGQNGNPFVKFADFDSLDRYRLFLTVAEDLDGWPSFNT